MKGCKHQLAKALAALERLADITPFPSGKPFFSFSHELRARVEYAEAALGAIGPVREEEVPEEYPR